jgi:hypothetical protein
MPEGKRDYSIALDQAWRGLEAADLAAQAVRAGATQRPDGKILLDFIGSPHEITSATRQITRGGRDTPDFRKILILHYLSKAPGTPAQNIEVGFAQIPGALGYFTPFRGRVIQAIVRAFDSNEEATAEAFRQIGATEKKFATRCFIARVFPRIDVKVIYWKGDEEMPSEGQIVFDKSVADYLPVEDIAVCCEEMVSEVKSILRQASPR